VPVQLLAPEVMACPSMSSTFVTLTNRAGLSPIANNYGASATVPNLQQCGVSVTIQGDRF
jgi:hypothetical protein